MNVIHDHLKQFRALTKLFPGEKMICPGIKNQQDFSFLWLWFGAFVLLLLFLRTGLMYMRIASNSLCNQNWP